MDDQLPSKKIADMPEMKKNSSGSTPSYQRRRFIRASAAAVPVIMTVRSSVAAAASIACDVKDAERATHLGADDLILDGNLDEWVRVEGLEITSGNDILYSVKEGEAYKDWYDASGSNVDKNNKPYVDNVNDQQIKNGKPAWFLAYVDSENGNYTWYPKSISVMSNTGAYQDAMVAPITGSCLCSVNPDSCNVFN